MKSAGKARNNGLYRHIRTSKEIIRNLLNDYLNNSRTHSNELQKSGLFPARIRYLENSFIIKLRMTCCSADKPPPTGLVLCFSSLISR